MLTISLACLSVVLTIPKQETSFDRLGLAVEQVENGEWRKPGGRACWTKREWVRYSALPFYYASNPYHSREAMAHAFSRYTQRLVDAGETPTPWKLAMIWHLGWDEMHRTRRTKDDFGERAANLYDASFK